MRIQIRVQLGSLILLASLIGLAVISVAVWITVHDFVLTLRGARLGMTAELKAAQLASNLSLMQTAVGLVSSRVLIQTALQRYIQDGNGSTANWADSVADLSSALGGGLALGKELLVQAAVFPPDSSGSDGSGPLFMVTGRDWLDSIKLPYTYANGTQILLGANDTAAGTYGYPPPLYPNLTYTNTEYNDTTLVNTAAVDGNTLTYNSTLLLGPWSINQTLSLVSVTMPILNNTDPFDILGWMTVVMDASLITRVIDSSVGLGTTGECLLIGPATSDNTFSSIDQQDFYSNKSGTIPIRYVVPIPMSESGRHPGHTINTTNPAFPASQFPAVNDAFIAFRKNMSNLSGSNVHAINEDGKHVSVGYAAVQLSYVDWLIFVEYNRGEIWQPINHVRNVILVCLFATAALMAVVAYPLAHFASLPILRLREATRRSIEPPDGTSRSSLGSFGTIQDGSQNGPDEALAKKEGMIPIVSKWNAKRAQNAQWRRDTRRKRAFRIPGKVKERKTWIKDELSDLTYTFNEMSDELMMQYSKLEERVQQRTAELELSKKAAEAANESKTLFIANISHELKTPLNGILGMCAVCMQEDDPVRLKRSLGIIYKSGDLLLNLLTDLLTFSKNQVGQQLSLDEKEFRLRDISSQTLAIFDKQAKEAQITLRVDFDGAQYLPSDAENAKRMHDMFLWGDLHRILQVVINLVSNSLKFTPSGGSVVLTIRCLADSIPEASNSRKPSLNSKTSRRPSARFPGSEANSSHAHIDTANAINAKDRPHALVGTASHDRAASPPPGRWFHFEFEVADTGPGIPEELHHKIFEPFVQGDLGLTKKYGGTGLGLSICSQLAQLMGGRMSVKSIVGVGSTFTMQIPLRHLYSRADSTASSAMDFALDGLSRAGSIDDGVRSAGGRGVNSDTEDENELNDRKRGHDTNGDHPPAHAPPRIVGLSHPYFAATSPLESPRSQEAAMEQIAAEASRGGKIRVLVAEDNQVNQEVVLRMLKLEDIYDVTVAKDGQEALDLVKASMRGEDRRPFNLIFMDVQMPNVDGLQSTRLIRQIGYQAPIVALTAFSEESNIKDCLDSGMNYFLSKPIRRPQLKKVLKEYCAPIPEENEEVTPPADSPDEIRGRQDAGPANTTIVMVNKGPQAGPEIRNPSLAGVLNSNKVGPQTNGHPVESGVESPGVSPHTDTRI